MPHPPVIAMDDFTEAAPPVVAMTPACRTTRAAKVSLTKLRLGGHPQGSTSFWQRHGDLQPDADGRFTVAPGADRFGIRWEMENGRKVRSARIDLFERSNVPQHPIWTKWLHWDHGDAQADAGRTPFDGCLDPTVGTSSNTAARVTITAPGIGVAYPSLHLTAARAPYKLRMMITSITPDAEIKRQTRWLYIDVVVADLRLYLGGADLIEQEPHIRLRGYNARNAALRGRLAQTLGGGLQLAEGANVNVDLDGNVFPTTIEEAYDNTAVDAWRETWGQGPYIPVVARLRAQGMQGQPVDAPLALHGTEVLWDWEGGDFDPAPFHADIRNPLQAAYANHNGPTPPGPAEWPTGRDNAHTVNGGKRGAGAELFKTSDGSRFDYVVRQCANRGGAAISEVCSQGPRAGTSGVTFWPSHLAGDQYRLRAYALYGPVGPWDQASTAEHLRTHLPVDVPYGTSCRFTIRRVVQLAGYWRKNDQVDASQIRLDVLRQFFEDAGIVMDTSSANTGAVVDRVAFENAYARAIATRTDFDRLMLGPADQQYAPAHGLVFKSYDEFYGDLITALHDNQDANDAPSKRRLLDRVEEVTRERAEVPRGVPSGVWRACLQTVLAPAFVQARHNADQGELQDVLGQHLHDDAAHELDQAFPNAGAAIGAAAVHCYNTAAPGPAAAKAQYLQATLRTDLLAVAPVPGGLSPQAFAVVVDELADQVFRGLATGAGNGMPDGMITGRLGGDLPTEYDYVFRNGPNAVCTAIPTLAQQLYQNSLDSHLAGDLIPPENERQDLQLATYATMATHDIDSDATYKARCKSMGNSLLEEVMAEAVAEVSRDVDGIHFAQVDFNDNFRNHEMAAAAISSPSNRSDCPSCLRPLTADARRARVCQRADCGRPLRSSCTILGAIPYSYYAFSVARYWSLPSWEAANKFLFASMMEGMRPEIMIAHEIGHHLFNGHPSVGVEMPNPPRDTNFWRFFRAMHASSARVREIVTATAPGYDPNNPGVPRPGSTTDQYHDMADRACIMGYNAAESTHLHFCAKCTLRMRGWDGANVQNV